MDISKTPSPTSGQAKINSKIDDVDTDSLKLTSTITKSNINLSHPSRHSISFINNSNRSNSGSPHNTSTNIPKFTKERRNSSFTSSSSSYARRRSFLSPTMINNEKHQVYELNTGLNSNSNSSSYHNTPSFSISLKESQGFCWNQDLFASQYQQQSNSVFDDDDDEDEDEVIENDDENQEVEDDYNSIRYPGRRSLSMSNNNQTYKVRVIDIKIDDDDDDVY